MPSVSILNGIIGKNQPVFVIAEAGVNHDGSLDKAFRLIDAACKVGADCVKFQTFKAGRVATPHAQKARYQKELTDPAEAQISMLKRLELSDDDFVKIVEYCNEKNIQFLSTPYNREDVDFLDKLGVSAFKLASISMSEPAFLSYVAKKGKPMIVSTGLANLAEIDAGVRAIRATGNNDIVLLQCTSNYPANPKEANLLAMPNMSKIFGVVTGYSDHTESYTCCIAAVALGACLIERHITLNRNDEGPDHAASSDPKQFEHLVNAIRETESALGSGIKMPTPSEIENLVEMRRSIVLRHPMSKGQKITIDDIDFRRPGDGIRSDLSEIVEGAILRKDAQAGVHLSWSDLELG